MYNRTRAPSVGVCHSLWLDMDNKLDYYYYYYHSCLAHFRERRGGQECKYSYILHWPPCLRLSEMSAQWTAHFLCNNKPYFL
jgi:hypothetical protein